MTSQSICSRAQPELLGQDCSLYTWWMLTLETFPRPTPVSTGALFPSPEFSWCCSSFQAWSSTLSKWREDDGKTDPGCRGNLRFCCGVKTPRIWCSEKISEYLLIIEWLEWVSTIFSGLCNTSCGKEGIWILYFVFANFLRTILYAWPSIGYYN